MNPQMLTTIALTKIDDAVRTADEHRRARAAMAPRERGSRPARSLRRRLGRGYSRGGDTGNVQPVHRAAA